MTFTKEQIDLICPTHNRSSCFDDQLSNWYYRTEERRLPRCNRCFLLNCLETEYWPDDIQITMSVQLSFKPLPCKQCHGTGVY
jgi:hypothetical protein